ncbi:TPM domain-containing protein [Thermococcus alcaliphilus]|uniref:TPM domain-containing protein n=1 Tax=Thermococcus alcaliphilus TaxID=139207 RepID=UPI0020900B79|nr:TPM domain-containing protein [Thermococcus alcaliphilus]MCO6041880.1 TPM domain-containing protein [Thermococcus alcaliphilus]
MRRRGFVFTLDALLSLILVMVFVSGMVAIIDNTNVYTSSLREGSKYKAEDVLTTLRNVPLKELVSPEILENWSTSGALDESLVNPDMSPLDIIATYWATRDLFPEKNLTHKAELILGYLLNKTLEGYYYELLINNYTSSYLRKVGGNYSKAFEVSPATLTLSGYKYNQTPRGYMARAYLSKATLIREDLIGIHRALAAACSYYHYNTFTLMTNITIPEDAKSIIADGRFVKRTTQDMDVYLNNTFVTSSSDELIDISDYINPGSTPLKIVYSNGPCGYELGVGSGTTLHLKYQSSSLAVEDPGLVKLYDLESDYTGITYFNTLFVPGEIRNINIHLKTEGVDKVKLYYSFGANTVELLEKDVNENGVDEIDITNDEIKNALQTKAGMDYVNLSKTSFTFILALDSRLSDDGLTFEYGGRDYGGERRRKLYGYPNSWIKIDYVPRILITLYSIPLSIYIDYNDVVYSSCSIYRCSQMQVSYTFPPYADPWYSDLWVGINFNFYAIGTMEFTENGYTIYNGSIDKYLFRIAYTRLNETMMVPGSLNTFIAQSYTSDYGFREGKTRGIIKYFIQGYAGYGEVFPFLLQGYPTYKGYNLTYYYNGSSGIVEKNILVGDPPYKSISIDDLNPDIGGGYAVDDAILRLFDKLNYRGDSNPGEWRKTPFDGSQNNPIDVDLSEEVRISFVDMGEIPGLFEPVQITLRVWRED